MKLTKEQKAIVEKAFKRDKEWMHEEFTNTIEKIMDHVEMDPKELLDCESEKDMETYNEIIGEASSYLVRLFIKSLQEKSNGGK